MLIKSLMTVALLCAALASNGTGPAEASNRQDLRPVPAVPASETSAEQPAQEVREEFHQTYPLSATGRVILENINGGVQIKVWDRAAVQVDAVKRAHRKDRLAEAKIQVNSTEEYIKIETDYPYNNMNFRSDERRTENPAIVEYSLTVPRQAVLESIELVNGSLDIDGVEGNVKASSINGRLVARGLAGEAKLSTVNGPLQAVFARLDDTKPLTLGSVNGPVTLVIPSNANASVRASNVHGGISTDFNLPVKRGEYIGNSLDGQIGTGGPKIKLSNVNGPIKVTHAQDGHPLSPGASLPGDFRVIREGDVRVEVDVEEALAARERAESARIARQAHREAQRQVNAALRQASREVEQAQREVMLRQAREQRVAVVRRPGVGAGGVDAPRVTSQETRTFTVSGTPRVSITTFDGPVTIRGWDKQEVSYTATRHAYTDDALKQITIRAQQLGQAISVNAEPGNDNGSSVHIDVYVPRQSSIHVSSGDGALNLEGVSGNITLRSGDGPIEVANGGGQLQLTTGDGVIKVIKFEGQVDARTGDGPIELDGNFNALSARTGDGTITLAVPAGSSFTIETNAPDEISNEGFIVAEDVTLSPRLKRWRIGNGGKVFVLKTGEGKIHLRPRN